MEHFARIDEMIAVAARLEAIAQAQERYRNQPFDDPDRMNLYRIERQLRRHFEALVASIAETIH